LKRKGQLQIQETMLVLFIFIMIVGLSLIVFYRFNLNSINQDVTDYKEYKFKQLISIVPNMPELRLSKLGVESKWCIDLAKARAFGDLQDNYEFGYKRITISGPFEVELYNNQRDSESVRLYSTPICVYDYFTDTFQMCKLEVEWYV